MKKRLLALLLILTIIFSFSLFTACGNNENTNIDNTTEPDSVEPVNDDDYTIEIKGLTANSNDILTITKAQIKELYKTKPVVYTDDNPVTASDKQDTETGELIPHTLKGVYFDDLLEIYADGAVSGAFSAMSIYSTDTYIINLTSETYNVELGGSKMIICFEYDGYALSPNAKSGALRAIFPNQPAGGWAKFIKTIEFSSVPLTPPAPTKLNFIELLNNSYDGQFTKEIDNADEKVNCTYYGISLNKLFTSNILNATAEDKMYIKAWDYITDGTNSFSREYSSPKCYETYSTCYLVYYTQLEGGEKEADIRAPVFKGENTLKGMTVKNVLSLSVSDTALVSLDIAFDRYGESGSFKFDEILQLVNMANEDATYVITDINNDTITLNYNDLSNTILSKSNDDYVLTYNTNNTLNIKSIEIQAD